MKKILTTLAVVIAAIFIFNACTKVESLPYYANGTAITLSANKTAVTATPADSNNAVIAFSWSNPKYASDSTTYKYILEIDSTGRSFVKVATKIIIGKLNTTITGKELNAILLNYGFTLGSPYNIDVRVTSSYGNNNERYLSNVLKIAVTPYNDPSVLTTAQTSVSLSLANSSTVSNTFSWTPSFNGYLGAVTYSIQYDSASKNFVAPQEIAIGTSLYNKALTQGEMNTTALNSNIAGGNTGKVEYRLKAITAQGAISYSNVVNVTIQSYQPLLRFYMPGNYQASQGAGNDWAPPTAPELIRDTRSAALNKLYYTYVYLPANTQFKVTQGRAWTTAYGSSTNTTGTSGNLVISGPDNFNISVAGIYRISIDVSTMNYDVRLGRMGFVGGAVPGNGWTPATTFIDVNSQMGYVKRDVFIGVNDFAVDGWKMIDYNDWNNGDISVANVRSYGASGNGSGNGSSLEVNAGNIPNVAAAGRYRVIWDGTDVNDVKYVLNSASEMRVVGDGMNQSGVNDWDPPTSPQMTYIGNSRWQITIALKANKSIKFLAGNAWGAFDYEDNGAGTGSGVRKIKWDGSDNFSTPATAGTYTIILDEKNGTVSIN
ncbi:MAG: SusE domain-containing protein [Chitinophagaceae bacterium]